jgi:glucose-fructose oxidoreductase
MGLGLLPSLKVGGKLEKKLGVALVGLGNYATAMLGPALLQTEHCYLSGIVSGTADIRLCTF